MAESNSQVKNAGPFPDIPLAVLAATDHGPYFKQWEPTLMHLQQELATLSPRATSTSIGARERASTIACLRRTTAQHRPPAHRAARTAEDRQLAQHVEGSAGLP